MNNYRNKYKRAVPIYLMPVLLSVTVLSGCATTGNKGSDTQQSKVGEAISDNKESVVGASVLGILGAGIGYALGGKTGAEIGGGTGLALGAAGGQVLKQNDKKRTATVSGTGDRPGLEERESIAQHDKSTESMGTSSKQVSAVAQVQDSKSKSRFIPRLTDGTSSVEVLYNIVRDGRVVGSISFYDDADLSDACAKLELRKH